MLTFKVPALVLRQSYAVCRTTNFGQRGFDDGTPDQQFYGVVAQNCMALAFGFPFVEKSDTWDGGFDFMIGQEKIDIKNVTRRVNAQPEYEARVVSEQIRYDVNVYLFTSYNVKTNELSVCGWLPKDVFLSRARFYKRGDVIKRDDGTQFVCRLNSHQIYYHQLNHIADSLDQLKEDIELFSILG